MNGITEPNAPLRWKFGPKLCQRWRQFNAQRTKGAGGDVSRAKKTRLDERARSFSSRLLGRRLSLKNTFGHLMDIAPRGGGDHVRFLPFSPAVFRHRAFGSIRNGWRSRRTFQYRVADINEDTKQSVYNPSNVRRYEVWRSRWWIASWTIIRYAAKSRDLYTSLRGFGLFGISNLARARRLRQSSPAAAVSQSASQLLSTSSRYYEKQIGWSIRSLTLSAKSRFRFFEIRL